MLTKLLTRTILGSGAVAVTALALQAAPTVPRTVAGLGVLEILTGAAAVLATAVGIKFLLGVVEQIERIRRARAERRAVSPGLFLEPLKDPQHQAAIRESLLRSLSTTRREQACEIRPLDATYAGPIYGVDPQSFCRLQAEVAALRQRLDDQTGLTTELEGLRDDLDHVKADVDTLDRSVKDFTKDVDSLHSNVRDAEDEIANLGTRIDQLDDTSELIVKIDDLRYDITRIDEVLANLGNQLAALTPAPVDSTAQPDYLRPGMGPLDPVRLRECQKDALALEAAVAANPSGTRPEPVVADDDDDDEELVPPKAKAPRSKLTVRLPAVMTVLQRGAGFAWHSQEDRMLVAGDLVLVEKRRHAHKAGYLFQRVCVSESDPSRWQVLWGVHAAPVTPPGPGRWMTPDGPNDLACGYRIYDRRVRQLRVDTDVREIDPYKRVPKGTTLWSQVFTSCRDDSIEGCYYWHYRPESKLWRAIPDCHVTVLAEFNPDGTPIEAEPVPPANVEPVQPSSAEPSKVASLAGAVIEPDPLPMLATVTRNDTGAWHPFLDRQLQVGDVVFLRNQDGSDSYLWFRRAIDRRANRQLTSQLQVTRRDSVRPVPTPGPGNWMSADGASDDAAGGLPIIDRKIRVLRFGRDVIWSQVATDTLNNPACQRYWYYCQTTGNWQYVLSDEDVTILAAYREDGTLFWLSLDVDFPLPT